jgi:hypothetical protein
LPAEQAAQQALALAGAAAGLWPAAIGLSSSVRLLAAAHRFAAVMMSVMVCLMMRTAHAFREFHLQLVVADHLGDQADDAAAGDHPVAALDAGQHLALRLHLGLLRADQQEVEDDEDQDSGKSWTRKSEPPALSPGPMPGI